jgi:protein involved in polysaccharide export with SLBB domain/capsular polysaccharide biosynthesis protein/Mrp family chromosome partitioning ATPase
MKQNSNGDSGQLQKRDPDEYGNYESWNERVENRGGVGYQANGQPAAITFWTAVDILAQKWGWLFLGGLMAAGVFFLLGTYVIKPKYTASAELLREDNVVGSELFKQATPLTAETFAGLIRSPELLARVGTNVEPAIPPERLIKMLKIDPEPDSAMVKVLCAAREPQTAVTLLNAFLREAEQFTREWQQERARVIAEDLLTKQVGQMDEIIDSLATEFKGVAVSPQVTNKLAEVGTNLTALSNNLAVSPRPSALIQMQREQLTVALADLNKLLLTYTEKHPIVQEKQALIKELQNNLGPTVGAAVPATSAGGTTPADTFALDVVRTKLHSLQDARTQLLQRQQEAEWYATNAPPLARIHAPATMKTVQKSMREIKIALVTVFGGGLGVVGTLALVMLVELLDRRLRTADDVKRVTKLPVLTTLGNLQRMPEDARAQWAFRAWTMLQGRLSRSANHGLVCGITSSTEGEGRSTWIHMLAEAASLTGFRVLTISTRPSPTHMETAPEEQEQAMGGEQQEPEEEVNGMNNHSHSLTTNVLASPAKVTEQLTGPNSQPMVHIPLPGWVWNLERRKQWREALMHWRQIENLVIFVELPPASVAEAVLLGANLPNLIWLADSGTADAGETQTQLETLRHARCNLVGAVLNRERSQSLRRRFPRWLGSTAAVALMLATWSASAQDNGAAKQVALAPGPELAAAQPAVTSPAPPAGLSNSANSFSVVGPEQRAAWQQRLTLGPGDVVTLSLYGQPEFTRSEVMINPDGYLNYLEASVLATGLTIDELRAKLDEALSALRRAPHSIITPVAFRSKKYYMLGKVVTKGVYTLDRPITVLEAIARAHGLENGLVDRNIMDLADFQRSFVMRGGRRIALNFERLFQEGDLSQNIPIEPGDYIYFPSTNVKEVYVVGEVRLPGVVTFTPATTIMAAISSRGGYTERAYKARVLVIRGSLNNPERFAVDTHAILDGKAPDFKLRPKDVIFVNSRPFIRVEELADLAITAFIQSLIAEWVGVDVVKPIQ